MTDFGLLYKMSLRLQKLYFRWVIIIIDGLKLV
jgi:hypothetical protein